MNEGGNRMSFDEKKLSKPKTHNIIMENREKLSISGVLDVGSFNTESVALETEMGMLTVKGDGLRISKLNLENAEMIIEGDIISCIYSDDDLRGKGFGLFGRMFR